MSPVAQEPSVARAPALDDLVLTVVHDNYPCVPSLKTAWGFSALVTGAEKTILFDTGCDGTLLLENMASLQIDPGRIDIVVLSHVHKDHTGGLTGLLQANPRVQVCLPAAFPTRFKESRARVWGDHRRDRRAAGNLPGCVHDGGPGPAHQGAGVGHPHPARAGRADRLRPSGDRPDPQESPAPARRGHPARAGRLPSRMGHEGEGGSDHRGVSQSRCAVCRADPLL